MKQDTYVFSVIDHMRYYFISEGKQTITKVVEFTYTENKLIVNLAFGDLLPGGGFDDEVISNNGDTKKVLATVVKIAAFFSDSYPRISIIFTGSSPERLILYERILRVYYKDFNKKFLIIGVVEKEGKLIPIIYEPSIYREYILFFIKRNLNLK